MQANVSPFISAVVRKSLNEASNVFVLTGAGISAESGVPTFRGGGQSLVWKWLPFSAVSSSEMLESKPEEVWAWFEYRREILRQVQPNAAHYVLSRWQQRFASLTLITQNVDGLHQQAGSEGVIELHGNIWKARCLDCSHFLDLRSASITEVQGVCSICCGKLRPDVVLFGEMLPAGAFEKAVAGAENCDVCLVVGTSAAVYPAAALPSIAKRAGAIVVEINCEETPLSEICDEVIIGKAGEVIPLL